MPLLASQVGEPVPWLAVLLYIVLFFAFMHLLDRLARRPVVGDVGRAPDAREP